MSRQKDEQIGGLVLCLKTAGVTRFIMRIVLLLVLLTGTLIFNDFASDFFHVVTSLKSDDNRKIEKQNFKQTFCA